MTKNSCNSIAFECLSRRTINFDVNASYGLLPAVESWLLDSGLSYLNPSSIHQGGQLARSKIEEARDKVKKLIGLSRDDSLVFTSGATEANNTAIFSSFWNYFSVGEARSAITPSLVLSAIEHPSIKEASERLKELGVTVRTVLPRADNKFYAEDFISAVDETTKLVSVMHVNNETGQLLPVREIACAVKAKNDRILVHSDIVQSVGKLMFSLESLGVDLVTLSGHKIGALTGVGALAFRAGLGICPYLVGGPQEVRRRAGTENVLGIISFGVAAELIAPVVELRREKMVRFSNRLRELLAIELPETSINLATIPNIGNTLSLRVPGVYTGDLVVALDLAGVSVSSGSACASGKPEPSPVLQTMGLSREAAKESIRISVGDDYSDDEFQRGCRIVVSVIKQMRKKC